MSDFSIADKTLLVFQDSKTQLYLQAPADGKTEGPLTEATTTQPSTFQYMVSDQDGYAYLKSGSQFLMMDPTNNNAVAFSNTDPTTLKTPSDRANYLFAVSPADQAAGQTPLFTLFAFTSGAGDLHLQNGSFYMAETASDPNEVQLVVLTADAPPSAASDSAASASDVTLTAQPVTNSADSTPATTAAAATTSSASTATVGRSSKNVSAASAAAVSDQTEVDDDADSTISDVDAYKSQGWYARWIVFGFIVAAVLLVLLVGLAAFGALTWSSYRVNTLANEELQRLDELQYLRSLPGSNNYQLTLKTAPSMAVMVQPAPMMAAPMASQPPPMPPPSTGTSGAVAVTVASSPGTGTSIQASIPPASAPETPQPTDQPAPTTNAAMGGLSRGYPSLFGSTYGGMPSTSIFSIKQGGQNATLGVTRAPPSSMTATGMGMGHTAGGTTASWRPQAAATHTGRLAGTGGSITFAGGRPAASNVRGQSSAYQPLRA